MKIFKTFLGISLNSFDLGVEVEDTKNIFAISKLRTK